jgi:hypothetical protein
MMMDMKKMKRMQQMRKKLRRRRMNHSRNRSLSNCQSALPW